MKAALYYRPFNWYLDAPEVAKNNKRDWSSIWLLGFFLIGLVTMLPLAFSENKSEFLPGCEMISTSLVGNSPETLQRRSIYKCENNRLVDILSDL